MEKLKFTELPADVFEKLQINAGILLKTFNPTEATYERTNILGATTGGVNATCVPSYVDWGEDIDNCPKNTKELKHLESWECKMSGTMLTVDTAVCKSLLANADIEGDKITPRMSVNEADFTDIWYVCDYGADGGYIAICLKNALSSGGFSLQSTDAGKGQFAFEYTGHSTIADISKVPMEFYIHTAE